MPKHINAYDRYLAMPGDILPAQTVAQLAPMSALQNLCIDGEGTALITSLLDGRIWRVPFGGHPQMFAQIDGRPSGIAADPDGGWVVFGWDNRGGVAVFRLYADGKWEKFADVPGAIFPNGAFRLERDRYLVADSIAATIWHLDYTSKSVTPWYQHAALGPKPDAWAPALNGLQMFSDFLYMSNSSTNQLLRIKVASGQPVGIPEVVYDDIELDDFAFDKDGTLYSATHPNDVILKLTQNGVLTRSAGPAEGVRGCTACKFSPRPGDETGLYVITDGGLFNPMSGGLQNARLVRLEAGIAGITLKSFL
jgi:sugar lactone lactonase YvrE